MLKETRDANKEHFFSKVSACHIYFPVQNMQSNSEIIKQFCSVSHCSKTGKTGRESYSLREQRKLTFKLTLVKLASPFEMQSLISEYISSPPFSHAEILYFILYCQTSLKFLA